MASTASATATTMPRGRKRKDAASKNDGRRFVCHNDGCGRSFTRAEHLQRHLLNHSTGEYTCDRCRAHFKRRDLLGKNRQFPCLGDREWEYVLFGSFEPSEFTTARVIHFLTPCSPRVDHLKPSTLPFTPLQLVITKFLAWPKRFNNSRNWEMLANSMQTGIWPATARKTTRLVLQVLVY